MSLPVAKPCFIAGTPRSSGDVQDGAINVAYGGGRTTSCFSGMASGAAAASFPAGASVASADALFYSGAGRLNTVFLHQNVLQLSGVGITFYDSAIPTSGGPFAASGHRILAAIGIPGGSSGQFTLTTPQVYNVPFQSGLCVATKSGQVGFSFTFTPEANGNFPNA